MDAFDPSATTIRKETDADIGIIGRLISQALADDYHSWHMVPRLVDTLRDADSLTVSLVAIHDADFIGYIGATPVTTDAPGHWYFLGPLAVHPAARHHGMGTLLVRRALEALRDVGAAGIIVLGNDNFYEGFGFHSQPHLHLDGAPHDAGHLLTLTIAPDATPPTSGTVVLAPGKDA
ncbi:GNAT family N-acetyltransferase [Corynebacterium uberis]|uniref:GNAT family N-acetyltransferase n=1 Tax=Corynebacterium TaxID=1716 RepID=UPI001D09B01D|nr:MULTISPECIES: N-acetyltransferase [Corynebacterium]MCZ9309841.1 N-acetyltransferase [Corynebacterium sp. c6VSa_13]UDL73231.1 N-acetyltransferase [Corynebacterium uberis]UDL75892.1 N-acetyltransferase [Corynebacterium uberis]UDL78104.1 N-acetyltransferase [Corynebacterium uberis]UDL80387.1 N-acetyltransferase [Corynebacterium uberis]